MGPVFETQTSATSGVSSHNCCRKLQLVLS